MIKLTTTTLWIIVFCATSMFAKQTESTSSNTDWSQVDERSKTVPDSLKSYQEISKYLTKGLTKEKDKLRAIYIWITHNIAYDVAQYSSGKLKRFNNKEASIKYVLANKVAVCSGYADLLHMMAEEAGIEMYTILGYKRYKNGEASKMSHAWNGVHLSSGEWLLLDATWDAGYVTGDFSKPANFVYQFADQYFLVMPAEFLKDHVPFDPIWQFLETPISHAALQENDFSALRFEKTFHFQDTIKSWGRLSEGDRFKTEYRRVSAFKGNNQVLSDYLNYLSSCVDVVHENEAITLYNRAVEKYNSANSHLYLYNRYKSRNFKRPKVSLYRIRNLLVQAKMDLSIATESLDQMKGYSGEVANHVFHFRRKVEECVIELEEEVRFVSIKFDIKNDSSGFFAEL